MARLTWSQHSRNVHLSPESQGPCHPCNETPQYWSTVTLISSHFLVMVCQQPFKSLPPTGKTPVNQLASVSLRANLKDMKLKMYLAEFYLWSATCSSSLVCHSPGHSSRVFAPYYHLRNFLLAILLQAKNIGSQKYGTHILPLSFSRT